MTIVPATYPQQDLSLAIRELAELRDLLRSLAAPKKARRRARRRR